MTDQRPTWDDYPFAVYPGFTDDDWRPAASDDVSEHDRLRIEQLCADARDSHHAKHHHHAHPWCYWCELRRNNFERQVDGIPPITADNDHEEWREEADSCRSAVRSRARRYLVLHRNPPLDTYDPEQDAGAFDDEYLDGDALDTLPAPEPMIDGVLTRHAYAVLRGRDGTYKSFTALDWALCLASGKRWQGRHVESCRVLYVAGEGAYGLAARKAAWEYAWRATVPADMFTVRKSALNLYRPGSALDDLLQRIESGGYGLVVLDTLRRVSGGADGNSSDMGVVVDNIERIKRTTKDGSVLVIAHTDKGDNDSRGFSGVEDDADIVWHAKREQHRLTLTNHKMKDGPDGLEIPLRITEVLDSLVLEADAAAGLNGEDTTGNEDRILWVLASMFSETGASAATLRDTVEIPRSSFYRSLNALVRRGTVVNVGSKKAPHYELAPHAVSPGHMPADVQVSHESQEVSRESHAVSSRPTPLRGGTRDAGQDQVGAA